MGTSFELANTSNERPKLTEFDFLRMEVLLEGQGCRCMGGEVQVHDISTIPSSVRRQLVATPLSLESRTSHAGSINRSGIGIGIPMQSALYNNVRQALCAVGTEDCVRVALI